MNRIQSFTLPMLIMCTVSYFGWNTHLDPWNITKILMVLIMMLLLIITMYGIQIEDHIIKNKEMNKNGI